MSLRRKNSILKRITAFGLTLLLVCPMNVYAADQVGSGKRLVTLSKTMNGQKYLDAEFQYGEGSIVPTCIHEEYASGDIYDYNLTFDDGKIVGVSQVGPYPSVEEFTYNDEGYLMYYRVFDETGNTICEEETEYDGDRKIKVSGYLANSGDYSYEYTYEGDVCVSEEYYDQGTLMFTTYYTYDQEGVLQSSDLVSAGEIKTTTEYTYLSPNIRIERTSQSVSLYLFDSNGTDYYYTSVGSQGDSANAQNEDEATTILRADENNCIELVYEE